jgi:hypothetical protein
MLIKIFEKDPISKITRAKRFEAMAQAVEHLPQKHKALSSNSSTAKKKGEEGKDHGYLVDYYKPLVHPVPHTVSGT